jgi:hypothetical protein
MTTGLMLGAGFSTNAGYPLTREILPRTKAYWDRRRKAVKGAELAGQDTAYIHVHSRLLDELARVDPTFSTIDLEDLADWIAEHVADDSTEWLQLGRRDGWHHLGSLEAEAIPWSGKPKLMFDLLETILFHGLSQGQRLPSDGPGVLRDVELWNQATRQFAPDFVITPNYDCIVESAYLWPLGDPMPIDYGFDHQVLVRQDQLPNKHAYVYHIESRVRQLAAKALPLYKIHGSTNMAWCQTPGCHAVVAFPMAKWANDQTPARVGAMAGWEDALNPNINGRYSYHCGDHSMPAEDKEHRILKALMLPPQGGKDSLPQWKILAPVHHSALKAAAKCDRLIAIGCSFRPSDHLLANIVRQANGAAIEYYGGAEGYENLAMLDPNANYQAARWPTA